MTRARPELFHTSEWAPDQAVAAALAADHVLCRCIEPRGMPTSLDAPSALLVSMASLAAWGLPTLAETADRGVSLVLLGDGNDDDFPCDLPLHLVTAFVTSPRFSRQLILALRTALREAGERRHISNALAERAAYAREVRDLTETGIRLLTERKHDALLELIVSQSRRLTAADAASLYLLERNGGTRPRLVFKLSQNESRPDIRLESFSLPLDSTSLAGHAACSGEPLIVDDAYGLPAEAPCGFNRSIDAASGYRTKSMLVIPMPNQTGEVIGVLQLMNRKPPGCRVFRDATDIEAMALPFDTRTVDLARALAGQAAVSIENARLHGSIEQLFEEFVLATVSAIEQRDPATSGHSERVATLTCALAEAVSRDQGPRFAGVAFSPLDLQVLRYAALLHDVGKLGVREQVLVKARKLYPGQLAVIELRHALLRQVAESRYQRELNRFLYERGRDGFDAAERALRAQRDKSLSQLDRSMALVREADEPHLMPASVATELSALGQPHFQGPDGRPAAFLSADELAALQVKQGSLREDEWEEVRGHAVLTWEFLNRIPWTADLSAVPSIARGHHEKLDGSGYPQGLTGDAIALATRMMTVADIYDALSAADRPYKRAVPPGRALEILSEEARQGKLDADLVRLFIEARVFESHPGRPPTPSLADGHVPAA